MNSTENVLKRIENAREEGDFDLVKRLSKEALEDPQSDISDLLIMDQIAHMYLDSFLIWVNEMKKIDPSVDKYRVLCNIAIGLAENSGSSDPLVVYTPYTEKMADAAPEVVREEFLSVDTDGEDDNAPEKEIDRIA